MIAFIKSDKPVVSVEGLARTNSAPGEYGCVDVLAETCRDILWDLIDASTRGTVHDLHIGLLKTRGLVPELLGNRCPSDRAASSYPTRLSVYDDSQRNCGYNSGGVRDDASFNLIHRVQNLVVQIPATISLIARTIRRRKDAASIDETNNSVGLVAIAKNKASVAQSSLSQAVIRFPIDRLTVGFVPTEATRMGSPFFAAPLA
jgi:hypothetical protein